MRELLARKLYPVEFGAGGWFRILLSGIIANWLVGMAAVLGASGRTLSGKIVGIVLPILMFVALGVQHSPANMGYFSLALLHGGGIFDDLQIALSGRQGALAFSSGFGEAVWFNVIPAAIGNVIGGALLVAALLSYVYAPASATPGGAHQGELPNRSRGGGRD